MRSTPRHFQRAGQLAPAWSSASPLTEETDGPSAREAFRASSGNGTSGAVVAEVSVGPGRESSSDMCCVAGKRFREMQWTWFGTSLCGPVGLFAEQSAVGK